MSITLGCLLQYLRDTFRGSEEYICALFPPTYRGFCLK